MKRAAVLISLAALLTLGGSCIAQSQLYGYVVLNDTDRPIENVIVDLGGGGGFPMTVRPFDSSAHIRGQSGPMPSEAIVAWKDLETGKTYEKTVEMAGLLTGTGASSRVSEIEFVIIGPEQVRVMFQIEAGQFNRERWIPGETPEAKKARVLNIQFAELARSGSNDGFKALLKQGAQLEPKSVLDPKPIHEAVLSRSSETVGRLLDLGASPELASFRYSALIQAIHLELEDVARLLIERGADANFASINNTPLMEASEKGLIGIVRRLLEKGAEADLGTLGEFPLVSAAREGHLEIVELLLEAGADPNRLFLGKTVERFTRDRGQHSVAEFLARWVDDHGLKASQPSRAEGFLARNESMGADGELVTRGHPRFKQLTYLARGELFNIEIPRAFGGDVGIVETTVNPGITQESRIFAEDGFVAVIVVTKIRPELPQDSTILDRVLRNVENSALLGEAQEIRWRTTRHGRTLQQTILNEQYDDIAFPYGLSSSRSTPPFSTIGASQFFVGAGRLYEVSLILDLGGSLDAEAARREGVRVLDSLTSALTIQGSP